MLENIILHQDQPIMYRGTALDKASAAMILIHGRGATAESIMALSEEFSMDGFAYLAPQAARSTWYPYSFLAPIESNEPWLSSALGVVSKTIQKAQSAGIPANKTILLGFSQGACLAAEYSARNPQKLGGLGVLSGGLIGPLGLPFSYTGSLKNTPVFIGCSDIDPHIPLERVQQTTSVLQKLGAQVTEKIYPGMGHTIIQDEIDQIRKLMEPLIE
jgi:predicted esterase